MPVLVCRWHKAHIATSHALEVIMHSLAKVITGFRFEVVFALEVDAGLFDAILIVTEIFGDF